MSPSERRPRLGSLAQAARGKHLRQIRGLLIAIGLLSVVVYIVLLATDRERVTDLVDKEIRKQAGPFVQVDQAKRQDFIETVIRVDKIIFSIGIGLGVLYLIFAAVVHLYPVPVTVLALVIYVA